MHYLKKKKKNFVAKRQIDSPICQLGEIGISDQSNQQEQAEDSVSNELKRMVEKLNKCCHRIEIFLQYFDRAILHKFKQLRKDHFYKRNLKPGMPTGQ